MRIVEKFIEEIDTEIEKLQKLKQLVQQIDFPGSKPHSPRGPYKKHSRKMSAEARKKIGDAVRARWAGQKRKKAA